MGDTPPRSSTAWDIEHGRWRHRAQVPGDRQAPRRKVHTSLLPEAFLRVDVPSSAALSLFSWGKQLGGKIVRTRKGLVREVP